MPHVRIDWWKGSGEPERRRLVEEVTSVVARIAKCPEAAVHVIVNDIEKDHWGLGGKLCSEL